MTRRYAAFAIDLKSSTREKLPNGYLHVRSNNLTKAQVSPYLGREVSAKDELGWDDDKVYKLLRDPKELAKAVDQYNNLPLLMGHHDFTPEQQPKDQIIGTTGTDACFDGRYVSNSVTIWDASAIKAIEDGDITELSCGYSYELDPKEGTFQDEPYNGIMRNIRPEHVALVEKGRAGSDVRVGDKALDGDKPGHAGHGNQYTGGQGGKATPGKKGAGAGGKLVSVKKSRKGAPAAVLSPSEVGDIAKRKGVSPKEGKRKYGSVKFADPKNKKYPLDTPRHVRAALSYWGMPKNRAKYSKADQAVIGQRIRAAAKRLGIGTAGDSAGNIKETTMAKDAKNLSPLAHQTAGVIFSHLRTKLAADAAIKPADLLAVVKNVSAAKFSKQINGIAGTVKEKYGLDSADELRATLKAMDVQAMGKAGMDEDDEDDEDDESYDEDDEAADEDDEAEPDADDEDDEAMDDEDDENDEDDEAMDEDDSAEAGGAGTSKGPGVKGVAKKKYAFNDAKKGKKGMPPAMLKKMQAKKKAGDAAIVAKVEARFRALRQAEKTVMPLVGAVDGLPSASAVYRYALDHAGVDHKGIHKSALPALVQMAIAQQAGTASRAADAFAAPSASTVERFPGLGNLKKIG